MDCAGPLRYAVGLVFEVAEGLSRVYLLIGRGNLGEAAALQAAAVHIYPRTSDGPEHFPLPTMLRRNHLGWLTPQDILGDERPPWIPCHDASHPV